MRTATILTTTFLAAALTACGHDETKSFSCRTETRNAMVLAKGDTVTLSLRKEEMISVVPYVMGNTEVYSEEAPRHEIEYQKSVASTYCEAGTIPQPSVP